MNGLFIRRSVGEGFAVTIHPAQMPAEATTLKLVIPSNAESLP
jgi:hypothetical protein